MTVLDETKKAPNVAWDELLGTLFSKEDQGKVEWCIGAALGGGPKKVLALIGSTDSGKSAVLSLIKDIYEECRERKSLNIGITHEVPSAGFKNSTFMFVASLVPIQVRTLGGGDRLIEVRTTGDKFEINKYFTLMDQIRSDRASIGINCLRLYRTLGDTYYDISQENNK